jgi:O-antigen/teichoic acid export membrane protein
MGVGHVVSQAAWFGSVIVIATLVPPESLGNFAASWVIVATALLLMESGTRGSIIIRRELDADAVRHAVRVIIGTGVVLSGALAVLAGPIVETVASSSEVAVMRVLSATVAVTAVSVVPLALLQRELLFRRHTHVVGGASLLASGAAILAGLLSAGVWALVIRQVAYSVLVAGLSWLSIRHILPRRGRVVGAREPQPRPRREGATGFFALAVGSFFALNLDYFIVGNTTDADQLGLYALAFTLAFAPLTNFSWKLGTVLFPAAAATDLEAVRRQTLRTLRLLSLILLPLLPPAIALAPVLLTGLLGDEWREMVHPFQILLLAGVGQALVNVIGESLSGTGHINLHAGLQGLMCMLLAPSLVVLVEVDGIRGASLAHLGAFIPVAAAYVILGGRRLRLKPRDIAAGLAPVVLATLAQALATVVVSVALTAAGLSYDLAAVLASVAGALVLVLALWRSSWRSWEEIRALLRAAVAGGG